MNTTNDLLRARNEFQADLRKNNEAICQCCQRRARINKLRVHSTIALMLARLAYQSKQKTGDPYSFVHIDEFKPKHRSGNDFSIVKYWGLATTKPAEGEDKNSSGFWRLTGDGNSFINGKLNIEKYAYVIDGMLSHFGEDTIDMDQALNGKFSFSELLEHIKA